jgi:hypothetical protein
LFPGFYHTFEKTLTQRHKDAEKKVQSLRLCLCVNYFCFVRTSLVA